MKVLHVNTEDVGGGAANAAQRIHKALRNTGVDSHMLVLLQHQTAPHVVQGLGKLQREMHRIKLSISARRLQRQITPGNPELHSLNWFDSGLAEWINRSDFDLVNLHFLGADMLSVAEIGRIRKPVAWTMHDMWPISGAEHYDDMSHPGRYRTPYTSASRPPDHSGPDLDAWVWQRKRKAWAQQRIQLISPSRWLADCATQSSLMGRQPCEVIPNCVDTRCFKPIDRQQARHILGLDPAKRFVLFGAMSSTSNRRKGFHLLQPALQRLATLPGMAGHTELLVFGAHAPQQPPDLGLPVHYLGRFNDDVSLALLYSAADVFVAPSMQDNLPNTIVESLACGTPCVSFRIGGIPDLVHHKVNGWLSEPFDPMDLAEGILHTFAAGLKSDTRSLFVGNPCEESAVASRYSRLYEDAVRIHRQK